MQKPLKFAHKKIRVHRYTAEVPFFKVGIPQGGGVKETGPELSKARNIYSDQVMYSVIQKDGLSFVRLYFLNYPWSVNDLHNI